METYTHTHTNGERERETNLKKKSLFVTNTIIICDILIYICNKQTNREIFNDDSYVYILVVFYNNFFFRSYSCVIYIHLRFFAFYYYIKLKYQNKNDTHTNIQTDKQNSDNIYIYNSFISIFFSRFR